MIGNGDLDSSTRTTNTTAAQRPFTFALENSTCESPGIRRSPLPGSHRPDNKPPRGEGASSRAIEGSPASCAVCQSPGETDTRKTHLLPSNCLLYRSVRANASPRPKTITERSSLPSGFVYLAPFWFLGFRTRRTAIGSAKQSKHQQLSFDSLDSFGPRILAIVHTTATLELHYSPGLGKRLLIDYPHSSSKMFSKLALSALAAATVASGESYSRSPQHSSGVVIDKSSQRNLPPAHNPPSQSAPPLRLPLSPAAGRSRATF